MKLRVGVCIVLTVLLAGTFTVIICVQPAVASGGFRVFLVSSPPPTEWNKTYGGAGSDDAVSVQQTVDGGYVVAGYTNSFGDTARGDAWLVKTDQTGTMEWNKTYGGSGSDEAFSVVQTVDGGYVVAGYTDSFGAGDTDSWLVKVEAEVQIHDLVVVGLTLSDVTVSEPVNITVRVKNNGNVTESFNVTVSYNMTEIGTKTVTDLAAGAQMILDFTWDTTGVAVGTYTIEAVVETVTGETSTANNVIAVPDVQVVPEFPAWTSTLLMLIVLTVAVTIYKRVSKLQGFKRGNQPTPVHQALMPNKTPIGLFAAK